MQPASAADVAGPAATPSPKSARAVAGTCAADYARLCPEQGAADGRAMAMCLKDYRADLTLACRHAVTAALQHRTP